MAPATSSTPSLRPSAATAGVETVAATEAVEAFAAIEAFAERVGVELVDWPADEFRRRSLARAGVPRLLIVGSHDDTPDAIGIDEDWVRLPADPRDVMARLERLARLVERLQHDHPVLDPAHIVHFAGTSVVLSPSQAAVTEVLLERRGEVVARSELEATLWPDGAPGPKALDGVVFRLRRRLAGLGLVVRSAHARGFVMDAPDHPVTTRPHGPGAV